MDVLTAASGTTALFITCPSRRHLATPLHYQRHSLRLPTVTNVRGRGNYRRVWSQELLCRSQDLEAELYEFMEKSANLTRFPSKEDLIVAGREDLVRGISKKRGWLAYGWDSDGEEEENVDKVLYGVGEADDSLLEAESSSSLGSWDGSRVSSSRRPMDMNVSDDNGIRGESSHLEKQRIIAFGFAQRKKEKKGSRSIEGHRMSVQSDLGKSSHYPCSSQNSHNEPLVDINNNFKPDTWRTWSSQKSGDPLTNFEAAEIVFDEEHQSSEIEFVSHLLIGRIWKSIVQLVTEASSKLNCHLQHLESHLTSALQLFKCRKRDAYSCKDENHESLLKVLHKLSDALEFQQNEIKKGRYILRSIRARLAVNEGKIALEVIESRKSIEEKWKRLQAVEKVLSMLRSVWIVWSNSASEVLLAGSFDGWTSQRRMEKKNPRARESSLCLNVYPGHYEIKFIVDGVWTVDPLRPVVNSSGFENNLLIVA